MSNSLQHYGLSIGSSVRGILQASLLKWVAIPFSRRPSQPRDQTHVSCITGRFFTVWVAREAPKASLSPLSWSWTRDLRIKYKSFIQSKFAHYLASAFLEPIPLIKIQVDNWQLSVARAPNLSHWCWPAPFWFVFSHKLILWFRL